MSDPKYIILNGEIVEEQKARVSPLNRGMMYGDGCFETLRYYSGSFLRWDRHFQRLEDGLDYLGINPAFTAVELMDQVVRLIEANQLSENEAMIRIQVWRKGGRGYATDSTEMGWMIQAGEVYSDSASLKLTVAETRCIPSAALDRKYKLSNGLNYIKAAQEASLIQCDDSLMLTVHDVISETTTSNIFWVKDDTVYTPSSECDLLPGVTRELTIEVIRSMGIQLEEGEFELEEIQKAEAVFCTNSLIEVKEVTSLDNNYFEAYHPILVKLKSGFEQHKVKELRQ